MTIADVIAARTGQDGTVATPDGPRAARPKRRTFTAEYKLRIVAEYENAATPRERNALLRREGLYTSTISEWRRARDAAVGEPSRAPLDRRHRDSPAGIPLLWQAAGEVIYEMEGNLPDSGAPEPRNTERSRDRPDYSGWSRLKLVTAILMFATAVLAVIGALKCSQRLSAGFVRES